MLTIASVLEERGYDIIFSTATLFRQQVEAAGVRFVPLSGHADLDYRAFDQTFPDRATTPAGLERVIFDLNRVFGDAIPDQYQTVRHILESTEVDLILVDTCFFGAFPLLLNEDLDRPPVIACGVIPLLITSRDRPPMGMPSGPDSPTRNYLEEHRHFQAAFQPVQEHINSVLQRLGSAPLDGFILDQIHQLPDRYLQLTGESFEFPCSDLPASIRFVGPLTPSSGLAHFERPDWWHRLRSGRPTVLVTQGTVANTDLTELIESTIQALADEDVTVIASLGTSTPRTLSFKVPDNTHVVRFVPFEKLMPEVSLFVTNGGYGAVTQALQNGVPLVVAGTTEDKPFVASRVAWSGSGIDLQTERPSIAQLREAIRHALGNASYRQNAERIAANFRQYNTIDNIIDEMEIQARLHLERVVLRNSPSSNTGARA